MTAPMKQAARGLLAVLLLTLLASPATGVAASPTLQAGPDSVELEFLTGTAVYPSYILLEWQSVSEQQTAGYRLFRGVTWNPNQATLLVAFIRAQNPGSSTGAYYSYQDSANLTPGVVYHYWIEDLDIGGAWSQHRDDPALNPVVPWGCSIYDVVCNFVIDSEDISAIASLWNCAWGSACYDRHFDVNTDNIINVQDLLLTASRWGCLRTAACYN